MKRWTRRFEWVAYAACANDDRFVLERLSPNDVAEVRRICDSCPVRPECLKWAVDEQVSGVWVAGALFPDPVDERAEQVLKSLWRLAKRSIPGELARRGDI